MDEAEERAMRPEEPRAPRSADERRRLDRLEALRLSHARTREQLQRVRAAPHRQMLERALADLEVQMSQLDRETPE